MGSKNVKESKIDIIKLLKNVASVWLTDEDKKAFINYFNKTTDEKGLKYTSPNEKDIFNAFNDLKPDDIRVLVIGQDPYPSGKATGFAFLLNKTVSENDSLYYILKAINKNQAISPKNITSAENEYKKWVKENRVLLLNTALTLNDKKSKIAHQKAWKLFIRQIITKLLGCEGKLVIFLWGDDAMLTFVKCLDNVEIKRKIKIFTCYHPSKVNDINGKKFNCMKDFEECNKFLEENLVEWEKLLEIYCTQNK